MIYNKSITKLGITACLITISILMGSCGNCRWVEDCRCKDGGYWDCPEDPIAPLAKSPDIDIKITGERQSRGDNTAMTFTSVVKNSGNGVASKVSYTMKITRPDFEGFHPKTIVNVTKDAPSILAFDKISITNNFSDRTIIGHGIYSVSLEVRYTDEEGKTLKKTAYVEY